MKLLRKLRALFLKGKLDAEMTEEMQTHVEFQAERNLKAGMDADEARYAALRQFGNVARIQEQAREGRGWVWLEQFGQDVRYAFRQLARSPGFTVVVVLTLALGIGATTAIFSVVNTVILNPVGGPEPERLLQVGQRDVFRGTPRFLGVSPPVLEALLARQDPFVSFAWSDQAQLDCKTDDFVTTEYGAYVSPNFFSVLSAWPLLGRGFAPDEAAPLDQAIVPTKDTTIVLSHAWWQQRFGGDPQMVGRTIEMSGRHFTVVGIMPEHFQFPNPQTHYWIPAEPIPLSPKGTRLPNTKVFARLKPDMTVEQAQAFFDTAAAQLMAAYPKKSPYGDWWRMNGQSLVISSRPLRAALQDDRTWGQLHQTLYGLLVAIGFVLLIVCANVANLALARVERRQHELAVRAAIGAGRGRLMRQLLTENLILAGLGGAVGMVVTAWSLKVLSALNNMPSLRPIEIDAQVLGVGVAVSLLTAFAFGLAPIWRGGRVRVQALLVDGGMNATGGRQRSHYRNALVIGQMAFTVILLTGAGLMLRSVDRLLRVDPGFDPENLLFVYVGLPWRKYEPGNAVQATAMKSTLLAQLHERFKALPGVKAAGFQQGYNLIQAFKVDGRDELIDALPVGIGIGESDWFRAMRIPLLAGRYLADDDMARKNIVVINETMARQCWPGETAIGKIFRMPEQWKEAPLEVVGVVGDARTYTYTERIPPTFYRAFQSGPPGMRMIGGMAPLFVLRTKDDPALLLAAVRREMKAAEPALLAPGFVVARQQLFDSTLAQRTYRNYLAVFAGLGLLLSALGIYGVLAYSVARRTREIGIRIAIGAEAGQVRRMILGQGAWLIVLGLAAGLGASLGLTRFLQSQLFNVSPTDPLVLGAVAVVLSFVGLLACWLPARRAAKVDPVIALRAE